MKKLLKFFLWFFAILSPFWIAALFVYGAVRFNFWPPNCSIIPKLEPRRVCEFSKLHKAPKGKPALVTFWVTIPATTDIQETVLLALDGKEPIAMEKTSSLSFQKTIDATTEDTLSYTYTTGSNVSESKTLRVTAYDIKHYDYVGSWNNVSMTAILPSIRGVQTKDTWTINYNMNLYEDTRRNLDATMKRAKDMGSNDFEVFSFIDMAGGKDNFTLKETASPYYHWRDAAITASEMKKLANKGKKYGLDIVIHYNIGADYNQYYNVSPFGSQAGSGTGGDAAEAKAGDDFGRNEPKTKEQLDRYFLQLKGVLIHWATEAEAAQIAGIDITPQYRPFPVAPLYSYADEKFQDIITAMRTVYRGKIYASNFGAYGGFAGYNKIPQFINSVDGLYVYTAYPLVRPGASIEEMRTAHTTWLDAVERDFAQYTKPLLVVVNQASYEGFTNGKPAMEWGDYKEVAARGYKEGWQEQADSYEALLEALEGRTKFAGVITAGYWWDDLMAPTYVGTANNMETSIRSKPAEAVWKKWMLTSQSTH